MTLPKLYWDNSNIYENVTLFWEKDYISKLNIVNEQYSGTFIGGSDSHLIDCFWEVAGTYKGYFVILWLQVKCWAHPEKVGTLKPYLL